MRKITVVENAKIWYSYSDVLKEQPVSCQKLALGSVSVEFAGQVHHHLWLVIPGNIQHNICSRNSRAGIPELHAAE
jgi:hypothetical protein